MNLPRPCFSHVKFNTEYVILDILLILGLHSNMHVLIACMCCHPNLETTKLTVLAWEIHLKKVNS